MADLLNADGENPKRTLVFVNHVDLYTGKSISKVRDMLLLYLFRLKNRNLKHLEQQLWIFRHRTLWSFYQTDLT